MPCTICREGGCRADVCQSNIIDDSHRTLVRVLTETVEPIVNELSSWSAYRVSRMDYPPSSLFYQGEPDEIRRNICSIRQSYLSRDIQTNIKKKLRDVMYNWNVGLFKRVLPRLRGNLRPGYCEQYERLLIESRVVSPKTATDYKLYVYGLAMFILRKRLPDSFLDLSDVPDADLVPPRVFYHDRTDYSLLSTRTSRTSRNRGIQGLKLTMKMSEPDEKYLIDDICPICMEEPKVNNVVAYTCGHAFCCDCSVETLKRCGSKCPMCRTETTCIRFKLNILPAKFNALSELMK